jgi:transcriptional antiterminator RfaH
MPILAQEPELYPDNLFDAIEFDTARDRQWFAVHTRPRSEKHLARRLIRDEIWFHLPVQRHQYRTPKGRKCTSYLPLFPSYLFIYGDHTDRFRAMLTDRIIRILDVPDGRQLAFDLRQVQRALELGVKIRPQSKLIPGAQVRVTSGPFENFEGRIVKRQTGDVLLIAVHYLQQGITISLEDCHVEAI